VKLGKGRAPFAKLASIPFLPFLDSLVTVWSLPTPSQVIICSLRSGRHSATRAFVISQAYGSNRHASNIQLCESKPCYPVCKCCSDHW
jgi:hypothetical protein